MYVFSLLIKLALILFYSNELRRSFKSIVLSLQQIIQLVIFFIGWTFFWALVVWKFIGSNYEPDSFVNNFDNLDTSFTIMYSLLSFDVYPDCFLLAYGNFLSFSSRKRSRDHFPFHTFYFHESIIFSACTCYCGL